MSQSAQNIRGFALQKCPPVQIMEQRLVALLHVLAMTTLTSLQARLVTDEITIHLLAIVQPVPARARGNGRQGGSRRHAVRSAETGVAARNCRSAAILLDAGYLRFDIASETGQPVWEMAKLLLEWFGLIVHKEYNRPDAVPVVCDADDASTIKGSAHSPAVLDGKLVANLTTSSP
ncbi:uncharacterized protein L969DRAFT_40837, partial [Mixia osmundae IAM 14324]